MMKKLFSFISFAGAVFFLINISAFACTDFRLTAKDGTVLITRSMEFALDLKSNLRTVPQGKSFSAITPNGKPGMSWKSKYGYLFLDGLNVPSVIDGINEQGLSFEYLFLPNETQYQDILAGQEDKAVPYISFGDWVLGNFKNVDEVRQALPSIAVFGQKISGQGDMIFPLHAAIYDASGKGIIVEFVAGKMNVYENAVGILTNAPTYPWHITNLRNYIGLTPVTPNPVIAAGITFVATGQGAGMRGLPGDVSPPSRFVKISAMLKTVLPANYSEDVLNLAQHIINNVDIPLGFVREAQTGDVSNETTQWVVFKDLKNKVFYYRTYADMSLRSISLSKIDFSTGATELKMPLLRKVFIEDISEQLKNSGQITVN